jgi:hypothetical protein
MLDDLVLWAHGIGATKAIAALFVFAILAWVVKAWRHASIAHSGKNWFNSIGGGK